MHKHTRFCGALFLALCLALQVFLPASVFAQESGPSPRELSPDENYVFEGVQIVRKNVPGCAFSVEAYDISYAREAHVDVWRKADRSDLRSYDMRRFLTMWSADIDLGDFYYQYGAYNIEVVGSTSAGSFSVDTRTIDFEMASPALLTAEKTDLCAWDLSLEADLMHGAGVWFEVEDPDGETQRLEAEKIGDAYEARLDVAGKRLPGIYRITAFYGDPAEPAALASEQVEVEGLPEARLSINVNKSNGTFSIDALTDDPGAFESMDCAVWTQPNQSDLHWVRLRENGDRWSSDLLSVRMFGTLFGDYIFHAYATARNGVAGLVDGVVCPVTAENYVWQQKPAAGLYDIYILNPNPAQNVRVAAWSEANGQDDVVWYNAVYVGNGAYKATVAARNHRSAGAFMCHVYAGDAAVNAVVFDVPAAELMSPAERRIADDCQRVYNAVGTDLYQNYLWVVNNFSYTRRYGHPTPPAGYTREQMYAVEGLETRNGNCYTFAASFAALARNLGYDAQYVEGYVRGSSQRLNPHGFVFIRMNGATYICDPELQFASTRPRNLYMQPLSSPRVNYVW